MLTMIRLKRSQSHDVRTYCRPSSYDCWQREFIDMMEILKGEGFNACVFLYIHVHQQEVLPCCFPQNHNY